MFTKYFIPVILAAFLFIPPSFSQVKKHPLSINLTVSEDIKSHVKPDGRLLLFLSEDSRREPRTQIWPSAGNYIFAININELNTNGEITISSASGLMSTTNWTLDNVPEGAYYIQMVWDHDKEESRIDAPGIIHSKVEKVEVNEAK